MKDLRVLGFTGLGFRELRGWLVRFYRCLLDRGLHHQVKRLPLVHRGSVGMLLYPKPPVQVPFFAVHRNTSSVLQSGSMKADLHSRDEIIPSRRARSARSMMENWAGTTKWGNRD